MPSTQYNISMIKHAVQNYSREQIREVLDELQLIVYSENTMQTTKIDPATGMPPYIATTAGQRQYDCPTDCRETLSIFWERPQRQYSPSRNRALYTEYIFRNARYYKVAAYSTNALINTLATVTFIDDPGTTTDKYYHEYVIKPTKITSEQIQLTVPEELHWLLRKGVIAMLSSENYGETGFDDEVIRKVAAKIRRKLNKGTQARAEKTPWQEEYRDGEYPNSYYY